MSCPHDNSLAISIKPFSTLNESLEALVACLRLAIPFKLWMVTRVSGDDWSILFANDEENRIERGTVLKWSDSFCSRMVKEEGPRFAPDAQLIPSYREAPINDVFQIGAYIGQPLVSDTDVLYGTLCAVDPEPKQEFTPEQRELVVLISRTMSTMLSAWTKIEESRQTEAKLRYQAHTDALTGLANRQAWELLIAEENDSLSKLGDNALVMLIDLDGLKAANDNFGHAEGDRYIIKAAHVLRGLVREQDFVARIGGDEFAIFIRSVEKEQGGIMSDRIRVELHRAGVEASIGFASYLSHCDLREALRAADMLMYEQKALRKRERLAGRTDVPRQTMSMTLDSTVSCGTRLPHASS